MWLQSAKLRNTGLERLGWPQEQRRAEVETCRMISGNGTGWKQEACEGAGQVLWKCERVEENAQGPSHLNLNAANCQKLRFIATGEIPIQTPYPYGLLPGLFLGYLWQYIAYWFKSLGCRQTAWVFIPAYCVSSGKLLLYLKFKKKVWIIIPSS